MMAPVVKNNTLPPGLVYNLQQVLSSHKPTAGNENDGVFSKPDVDDKETGGENDLQLVLSSDYHSGQPSLSGNETGDNNGSKPIILVSDSDGIESPRLYYLVNALVSEGIYNVNAIALRSDKSAAWHSVSLKETVEVAMAEINGAVAYEISGTLVDSVSLAMSGTLFQWPKSILYYPDKSSVVVVKLHQLRASIPKFKICPRLPRFPDRMPCIFSSSRELTGSRLFFPINRQSYILDTNLRDYSIIGQAIPHRGEWVALLQQRRVVLYNGRRATYCGICPLC